METVGEEGGARLRHRSLRPLRKGGAGGAHLGKLQPTASWMSVSSIVSRSVKRRYIVANNPATHVIGSSCWSLRELHVLATGDPRHAASGYTSLYEEPTRLALDHVSKLVV